MATCARRDAGDFPPIAPMARRALAMRAGHGSGVPPRPAGACVGRTSAGLWLVAERAVVLVEERELEAVARLGVLAVGLRLEEVVPRQAVVVGDYLPVLLRPEEL